MCGKGYEYDSTTPLSLVLVVRRSPKETEQFEGWEKRGEKIGLWIALKGSKFQLWSRFQRVDSVRIESVQMVDISKISKFLTVRM